MRRRLRSDSKNNARNYRSIETCEFLKYLQTLLQESESRRQLVDFLFPTISLDRRNPAKAVGNSGYLLGGGGKISSGYAADFPLSTSVGRRRSDDQRNSTNEGQPLDEQRIIDEPLRSVKSSCQPTHTDRDEDKR